MSCQGVCQGSFVLAGRRETVGEVLIGPYIEDLAEKSYEVSPYEVSLKHRGECLRKPLARWALTFRVISKSGEIAIDARIKINENRNGFARIPHYSATAVVPSRPTFDTTQRPGLSFSASKSALKQA